MQLRFLLRIHHTSIRGIETGAFVAEFVEGSGLLKSGTFHFGDAGEVEVEMSEVQRIAETSDLTKGLRRREQQVRFVCVLKAKPEGETADSENDDADAPYFCATIDKNGWTLIKTILDKHHKKHEVFSHV